jgi:predicted TIM-barrel fold metal-dependent hydrolase
MSDRFGGFYRPSEAPEFKGNYYRSLADAAAWQGAFAEEVIDPDLPIVDAHHHLQEDSRGRYLLHECVADIATGHNIVATVHVQAKSMLRTTGPAAFRDVGETEFARGVAAMSASGQYGKARICEAIVGFADFRLHDVVPAVLDAHEEAAGGRFRGIRQISPWVGGELAKAMPLNAPEGLLRDPEFRKGFAHLARRGLSFDAWLFHPQLGDVVDLAKAFPDTPIVVNHLGGRLGIGPYAFRFDEEFGNWRASLKALAALPNVFLKIGGLGMLYGGFAFHTRPKPPTSTELAAAWGPFVRVGIETFGPNRCMMESNFPIDNQTSSYPVLWNAFKRITSDLSPSERAALFHGAAQAFYRMRKDEPYANAAPRPGP